MLNNKNINNKKLYKDIKGRCCICGCDIRSTLNIHRIKEGSNGGKYTENNSIVVDANCHGRIHSGEIVIIGKFQSTNGKVLIIIDKSKGEDEIIIPI